MVYKWSGYSYKVNAQTVGEEIEKIEAKEGIVTAKAIVKRARSKQNPMHDLFEWDDKKAAEAHRLHTARQVLCCLVTVNDTEPTTRAFVNIELKAPNKMGLYANIKKAMADVESRETVLKNALAELMAFKHKYESLTELAEVFEKIDELCEED